MSTLLVVPDGVSVRNFLLTDLVDRLAEHDDVVVALGVPDAAHEVAGSAQATVAVAPYPERPVEAVVRRTLERAHQLAGGTLAMRFNAGRPVTGSWRHRAVVHASRAAALPFARRDRVVVLARLHDAIAARRPEVDAAAKLLRDHDVRRVLVAHQRPLAVIPLALAARRCGIPSATFIFSWDNLTTKGRIAAPFDHFMVWSDLMAEELHAFYPGVTADRVHVVGTPQFDPVADHALLVERAPFLRSLGLDPDRPVICFSGGDAGTCPDDPAHLDALCTLVEQGQIPDDPQVVVRTAPVDPGDRFDAVRSAHPWLCWRAPRWSHGDSDWSQVRPTREDVAELANLVRHADVNVNMASTMSLDFAIADTPVVNLAWDATDPPVHGRPVDELYYRFDHYRAVVDAGAVRLARSPAELAAHVGAYLEDPSLDRAGRRRIVELELGIAPGAATASLVQATMDLAV